MSAITSSLVNPVKVKERIQILDILRGFAIFGILMVNMALFNSPMAARTAGFELFTSLPDQVASLFIRFFFEGKFFSLFSILFGIGFYMFLNKKIEEGKSVIPTFRWRLLFLLLFGVMHFTLLWFGDILFFYALFGFILILFKKKSTRKLKGWSIAMISIPVLITAVAVVAIALAKMVPEGAEQVEIQLSTQKEYMQELTEKAIAAYSSGSYSEIITIRLTEWKNTLGAIFFFYPNVFAMFLLGFYIAKKGWLFNIKEHIGVFRKMFWYGLILGIIGNGLYTYGLAQGGQMNMNPITLFAMIGFGLGGPFMTLFYLSALVLILEKGWMKRLLDRISYVGRMALSNYLIHSIICTTLFYSYGFGLYSQVSIWQGILIAIAIYGIQVWYSKLWLKRFYFGPFEWLWRSLTYRKRQPFKIPIV